MTHALASLNYVAVIVVTIASFLLGWLWYSPVLFAKAWMAEMKITPESIKAANFNMGKLFGTSFALTLVSTFAFAWLLRGLGLTSPVRGAELGVVVGLLVVGARLANGGLWEQRSVRLQAINIGHEVTMFALQGAIFAMWR